MGFEHLNQQIGSRISSARAGLPKLTVEMAASFLEISPENFRAIEAGLQRPTADQLMLLCDLLNVSLEWFFDGEN